MSNFDSFSNGNYDNVANRPAFMLRDAGLTFTLLRRGENLASIQEYASKSGLRPDEVLECLETHLISGALVVEISGSESFLHTAPQGRPAPLWLPEVPANMWERLRKSNSVEKAHAIWALLKDLNAVGWRTEFDSTKIKSGLGYLPDPPQMGILIGKPENERLLPLIAFPSTSQLNAPGGILAMYEAAGAGAISITCDTGQLDSTASAVRLWMLARPIRPVLKVYILEAPRYDPVLLSPSDSSIQPRATSIQDIGNDS